MRTTVIAVLAMLTALTATAGKIELVDPASIAANSGEQFINIYGTELGDHVLYSGKAGEFDLEISARSEKGITVYLPEVIVNTPDRYTIYVRGDLGTAGPAFIDVIDPRASQPLVLLVPDPIAEPATSRSGAIVRYDVWPYGGSDPNPVVNCTSPSGSLFPLGSTIVDCVATNSAGERADGQVSVTVYDGDLPTLKLPEKLVVTAEGPNGALVKFEATAFDEIDGDLPVSCNPPSGSTFRIGITTVDCVATDKAFNSAFGSFTVEVQNRGFLLIHVPDRVLAEAEGPDGSIVKFDVTADGSDDPRPEIKCDPEPGSFFRFGVTKVLCVARDRFGASAEGSFDVEVADSTPPAIMKLSARPDVLTPNKELVPVAISVEAVDVVDPQPRCSIVDVWSNDPITEEDWKLVSDLEVALRATTSGKDERQYYVDVLCRDSAENASGGEAVIRVPSGSQQSTTTPTEPSKKRSARH